MLPIKCSVTFIFLCFYLGLTAQTSDPIHFKHVTAMAEYAFRLKQQLANVNEHSFNNFQLRIGKIQNDRNFKVSNFRNISFKKREQNGH